MGSVPTDWRAIERSREFGDLMRARRRFLAPALAAVTLFYGGFVLAAALDPDALDTAVGGPFTLAHAWAVAQIPFAWVVALLYLRWCTRRIDPLTALTAQAASSDAAAPPSLVKAVAR
jgi:uncharacterized membrane protein (DUF485 family)